MKNPWEDENGKVIWETQSQYFVWLRGALRKLWSDYPLRQQWKKTSLRLVTPEEKRSKKFHPSTKNVGQCVFCEEWMAGSKLECDHIEESEGCYDFETASKFLLHCGAQTGENFQLACKPCHKIKSHQVKKGFETMEEARIDKDAIAWCKDKTIDHKGFLLDKGYSEKEVSNAKVRRITYTEFLTKEAK